MATLRKLIVQDFRNIALAELDFSPNVNCISGGNGEGKTNLLEAIYYLSMTKSPSLPNDRYLFRSGSTAFSLSGTYLMPNALESCYSIQVVSSGEKKLMRDDKPYIRISEHIGELPVVMVSPMDSTMVRESGEERRRFVNGVLSQMDREYLTDMQVYNKVLSQRNRMLKGYSIDWELMAVYDRQMSAAAGKIHSKRKIFAEGLQPIVNRYYRAISGGREGVGINYVSDLYEAPLEELLSANREKDSSFHYTTVGIQRDDLVFSMDGMPIRRCGSQGQQKSFLVSLKFAQYELMRANWGFPPMLLLDDVFDKLDMDRISNLLSLVAGEDFGQIFITDSNKIRLAALVDGLTTDRAYFNSTAGNFTKDGKD